MTTIEPAPADVGWRRAIARVRPENPGQLHAWIRAVLGFDMPRTSRIPGHAAPFDYLTHAFFEPEPHTVGVTRDVIVWANRGGGKTQLGAIATLLDLLFKPGIQIRILGGSLEQSSRMYTYLRRLLDAPALRDRIADRLRAHAVELDNSARVEVLAQSQTAVRGQRIHKLRCDEVELFDPEVWEAAQLTTRSGWCGDTYVRGVVEAVSTMHRPYGMMQRLVDESSAAVLRWNVIDVLERCPPSRDCETCPLWSDCQGRAKSGRGYIAIDDAIAQIRRVGREAWESEMLCERPSRADAVYPMFDERDHVVELDDATMTQLRRRAVLWIGGLDFGFRDPTVLLWACLDVDGVVHIVDEHVASGWTTAQHLASVDSRGWPAFDWIGCDPAGHQRSEQTGISVATQWRQGGFRLRSYPTAVESGIAMVSKRLRRADGSIDLVFHARCRRLIESLAVYRYPSNTLGDAKPVKDGADHAADALRYLVVNLERPDVTQRTY